MIIFNLMIPKKNNKKTIANITKSDIHTVKDTKVISRKLKFCSKFVVNENNIATIK